MRFSLFLVYFYMHFKELTLSYVYSQTHPRFNTSIGIAHRNLMNLLTTKFGASIYRHYINENIK